MELDITTNPGMHKVVMTGTTEDGRTSRQDEQSANITGTGGAPAYDYKFPDQLKLYQAGTRVLATDGNVYECKPFPNSGYCTQWAPTATSYEPGTGSHWQDAWIRK